MEWIPKCCNPDIEGADAKMRNQVSLYYNKLNVNIENGVQKNKYSATLVMPKRCYIKDRSIAAQDTAIATGIQNPESSKEFIFINFNVTDLKFNEIKWRNTIFTVLGSPVKLATVIMDKKRFVATDKRPFISIIAGMKKL